MALGVTGSKPPTAASRGSSRGGTSGVKRVSVVKQFDNEKQVGRPRIPVKCPIVFPPLPKTHTHTLVKLERVFEII